MTKQQNNIDGKAIYEYVVETGVTWREAGEHFGLTRGQARKRAQYYYESNDLPAPAKTRPAKINGAADAGPKTQGEELWQRALRRQEKQDQLIDWRNQRRVIFDKGRTVIVFMADLHLGNSGTDYRAIDHDIAVINEIYSENQGGVILVGDMLDNFIVGRLRDLRLNVSPFLAIEEWGLVDYALERLSPYLLGAVAGNHDNWSWSLVGVDILRERHRQLTPGILYDPLELAFWLQVGSYEGRVICRHDWRGHSYINPTHGMEHGQHTLGRDSDIRVGAHTHRGGLAREFANGHDIPGHALICGTYKKVDEYAIMKGYPPPLKTSAVAVVLDETGILFSTSNLEGLLR